MSASLILDPAIAVADGLYAFRCTVSVTLYEVGVIAGRSVEAMARTYGITAATYAEAMAVAEGLAGRALDDDGAAVGTVEGWLDEVEIAVVEPEDVPRAAAAAAEQPGVHFVSPAVYVDDEGELFEVPTARGE